MAWTPLSSRLSSLPLVLAGPIVRKTTSSSVSVWIAVKTAQVSLSLKIKDQSLNVLGTATVSTKSFGKNLHIAVVTVSGLNLNSGIIYLYDMVFDGNLSFSSSGVLTSGSNGISKITYGTFPLPSFLLPASSIQDLKIVQGSCRKIHGGHGAGTKPQTPEYFVKMKEESLDIDALSILSDLISSFHNDPKKRPQQLFLTGDQIYADDVSDLVLYMINDGVGTLIDINEQVTMPDGTKITPSAIHPLTRYKTINTTASMTSGEYAKSHLMSLGEFYMMYLFAWCDAIWTDPPDYATFTTYITKTYDAPQNNDHFSIVTGDLLLYHANQVKALNHFRSFLPQVRKALANISTYMMFDDHEITDDWFLTSKWCNNVLNNNLGKRIMQNGLSAFAAFQAWGNTPEKFGDATKSEGQLLAKLTQLKTERGNTASTWTDIGSLILPSLSSGSSASEPKKLIGGIDWYFYLDFSYYQVLVLNSRTRRGFNVRDFARLLSSATMDNQLLQGSTDQKYKFTIVIAPAPVIGHSVLEAIQKLAKGSGSLAEAAEWDYEPWAADEETLSVFLKKLCRFRRVIFLSGDVHYAYSARIDYQLFPGKSNQQNCVFLQFTSSSLKNSESKTTSHVLSAFPILGVPAMSGGKGWDLSVDLEGYQMMGWDTPGTKGKITMGLDTEVRYSRATEEVDLIINSTTIDIENKDYGIKTTITVPPDRKYTVVFLEDTRDADDRGQFTYGITSNGRYCLPAAMHKSIAPFDQMSMALGYNNLGYLGFSLSGTTIKAIHQFWYKPKGFDIGAWTIHESNL